MKSNYSSAWHTEHCSVCIHVVCVFCVRVCVPAHVTVGVCSHWEKFQLKKKSKVLNVFWWWFGFSSLSFSLLFKWFSLFYFSNRGNAGVWLLPSENQDAKPWSTYFPGLLGGSRRHQIPGFINCEVLYTVWGIACQHPGALNLLHFGAQCPPGGSCGCAFLTPGPESGLRAASLGRSSLSTPSKASGGGKTLPPSTMKCFSALWA